MIPIGLLIFDLDGTLVNTLDDIATSVNHTLECLGESPITVDAVRRYVGDGIEMLMQRSLRGKTGRLNEAISMYKDHHRLNLLVRSSLYPTVKETLDYYRTLPLAVVTNKTMEFSKPLLDGLGIGHYFKLVIGADHGMPLKPAPDSVLKIMTEFNVPKERTVIVGDGITDIRAGKAAGIITCSVTYGFRSDEELRKAEPDYTISVLSDLRKIFVPAN
jgi:phosphoglycolate phosphatase